MLKLVATPIGNLGDITLRALEALREADVIYAEDTRHTLQLLNHFSIKKPLVSCHSYNEQERAAQIVPLLREGQEIVYVSDAGMPGVSDPGAALVGACVENDLPYTVLPGASAVLTAAVLSGLPCAAFSFFGFLPRDGKQRREAIAAIGACGHLALLYESPHRVADTFRDLYRALGDRPAALLRELTKRFETAHRGTLSSLAEQFAAEPPRGECVIAVLCERAADAAAEASGEALDALLGALLREGASVKDAARQAAEQTGATKKSAYARALALRSAMDSDHQKEEDQ